MSIVSVLGGLVDGLRAGRVLDVATGRGGLIHSLLEAVAGVGEIVGVDSNADVRADFEATFPGRSGVRFQVRDAYRLAFENGWFDMAMVGASLHHFAEPEAVLQEMRRVVRPRGHLLVVEMYRDGQPPPEQTHVELHRWWAEIDTLRGTVHRETFERAEIVRMIDGLGLEDLRLADDADDGDPMAKVAALDPIIDRYLAYPEIDEALRARGEALRTRLHSVGLRNSRELVAVGRRP